MIRKLLRLSRSNELISSNLPTRLFALRHLTDKGYASPAFLDEVNQPSRCFCPIAFIQFIYFSALRRNLESLLFSCILFFIFWSNSANLTRHHCLCILIFSQDQ